MNTLAEKIEELIIASRGLDERAAAVQGERELLVEREVIDQLADDYHRWYAQAMAVLGTPSSRTSMRAAWW